MDASSLNVDPKEVDRNSGYNPRQLLQIPHCPRVAAPSAVDFSVSSEKPEQTPPELAGLTILAAADRENGHPCFVVRQNVKFANVFSSPNHSLRAIQGHSFVVSSLGGDSIFVYRGNDREILHGHIQWILALALVRNYAVVGGADGTVAIWNFETKK